MSIGVDSKLSRKYQENEGWFAIKSIKLINVDESENFKITVFSKHFLLLPVQAKDDKTYLSSLLTECNASATSPEDLQKCASEQFVNKGKLINPLVIKNLLP